MTVATPPNDDTKLLFRLLADRGWHNYIEVREEIAKTVAPGRAIRKYRQDRINDKSNRLRHHNDPLPESRRTESEQIEFGQRSCATSCISSWKKAGAILQRGQNNGREIKVRDGFTSYGIPGFEPGQEEPDPTPEAQGVPEVPPADSKPSEVPPAPVESPSVLSQAYAEVFPTEPAPPAEVVVESQTPPVAEQVPVEPEPEPVQTYQLPHAVSPEGGYYGGPGPDESCELCGLTVGNAARHSQWHEETVKSDSPSDMALLNESQLRDLLRKVLVDVLDSFQEGMQTHIDSRFAEVETRTTAMLTAGLMYRVPPRN